MISLTPFNVIYTNVGQNLLAVLNFQNQAARKLPLLKPEVIKCFQCVRV